MGASAGVGALVGAEIGGGKYRATRKLGAGGFGTVYAATEYLDGHPVREVALKLFDPEASRNGNVEGMLADCALPARIMASDLTADLAKHFVPIYDFGYIDTPAGRCAFIAMELVQGAQTLSDIMNRYRVSGRFPHPETVLDYMRQLFAALGAAHSAGVLHRDIKGANAMVDRGVLRIMDFGMGAYASTPRASLRTTISIFAPENFEGRFTESSDIYQAGLMFYQLYTGIEPFPATPGGTDWAAERHRRIAWHPRPGREIPGAHPSAHLDEVLSGCLAYSEVTRFASAPQVLAALNRPPSTPNSLTMDQAAAAHNWPETLRLATETLADPTTAPPTRLAALRRAAESHAALGATDAALAHYRDALALAESTTLDPTDFNALIDALAALYQTRGQPGMSRLTRSRRHPTP